MKFLSLKSEGGYIVALKYHKDKPIERINLGDPTHESLKEILCTAESKLGGLKQKYISEIEKVRQMHTGKQE